MQLLISHTREIPLDKILQLYRANQWSSAEKPKQLYAALMNSHSLVTAWLGEKLVGLGNAISDGHLVVYYPHLLVHPDYQRKQIGRKIMEAMQQKYGNFHMQMLTADGGAIDFYEKIGFTKAGATQAMWIYSGNEH